MPSRREVILVPGLWVPRIAMVLLGARLARAGLSWRAFGYSGRSQPLAAIAERLARFARANGPAHFVGHSLGGLAVLAALEAERSLEVGAAVLLGTPACGSVSGRQFARTRFGCWMLGESASLWAEDRASHWSRPEPLGVIAGSLPLGLGRFVTPLPEANDGVVRVEETAVEGMRERAVLPVSHSGMVVSARVAAHCARFLQTGHFDGLAH